MATLAQLEARIAALQLELASRRAAAKAARDKRLARLHAKAKKYRDSHRDAENARSRRWRAAAKESVEAAEERKALLRGYNTTYQAKRRARLAAASCQLSP